MGHPTRRPLVQMTCSDEVICLFEGGDEPAHDAGTGSRAVTSASKAGIAGASR
jgi:hypothetical protein